MERIAGSNPARPILIKKEVEMEVPSYSIKQNITRILFPRILNLLLLSALLYVGIRVNFIVFSIEFPNIMNIFTIMAIMVAAAADVFLVKSKNKYNKVYFFNDRIEISGKEQKRIMLAAVNNTQVKKNLFDKVLNTGSILLDDGNRIDNLNYPERVNQYIIQLIKISPQVK